MLRACHRVLKPGGLISFLVIAMGEGLTAEETSRALEAGPDHVATDDQYPALLHAAGFDEAVAFDVTDEYETTLASWIGEWDADATELGKLLGAEEFAERQTGRGEGLQAIRDGLLKRYHVTGARRD